VLGTILGLQSASIADQWFEKLVDHQSIAKEISELMNPPSAPKQ